MASAEAAEISFLGIGDVGPVPGPNDGFPIERYTELVRPTLAGVDLRFGNCERQYSDRGANARGEDGQPHRRQSPSIAQIFTDCGFDAVTIANNHMWDNRRIVDTSAFDPERNSVVEFELSGIKSGQRRWWILFERGEAIFT